MTTGKRKDERVSTTKPDRLGQLKLLVAFDALLREGSVSRAAAGMELPTSSMSRILQQLRDIYGDQLFLRTGQGLRPTPFAESMRLRIRSLAAEAENLMDYSQEKPAAPASASASGWERPVLMKAPPLSLRPPGVTTASRRNRGGPCRARTCDPLIKSQLLYQLS